MRKPVRSSAFVLTIILLAPLLLAGCATAVSEHIEDATITTHVKTALLNDPAIKITDLTRIDVDTVKGVVTLSGRVATKEEEARAIELARRIRGVSDVKSTLQIQP